ncbi:MAG: DUF4026 domain-containing protein [Vicinamibacteria bacterium]
MKRDLSLSGLTMFRGGIAPQLVEVRSWLDPAYEVQVLEAATDEHWHVRLRHPVHGAADVRCPREQTNSAQDLIHFDPRLTDREKSVLSDGKSHVEVRLPPGGSDLLVDRKRFLRFMAAVGGDVAVGAHDILASCWWTPDSLAEELSHDAPVDISALFTIHAIYDGPADESRETYWLHTHGLREAGFTDYDVLAPHPEVHGRSFDVLRALAFSIVEEQLVPDGDPSTIVRPGGDMRLVPAKTVLDNAGSQFKQWRDGVDDFHLVGHSVVCDPGIKRSFFGLGPARATPSTFLSNDIPDGVLIMFSNSASVLMAYRAQATYNYLRRLKEEFGELAPGILVKLGYPAEGGADHDREHIWFEVNGLKETTVDATCINTPFNVPGLQKGQRGEHPIELLSDWMMFTPFGSINPRFQYAARAIRADPEEARRQMDERRAGQPG